MMKFIKIGIVTLVMMILLLAVANMVWAAPYNGEIFKFKQPDGSFVQAKIYGDEYYQRAESLDGYTICRDKNGWLCYAVLNADGSEFVSSGVIYRGDVNSDPPLKNQKIQKGLKLNKKFIMEKVNKNRRLLNPEAGSTGTGVMNASAIAPAPAVVTGQIKGLALLINFPDQTSSISKTEIDNMLNQTGYTGYSNNGSVRDYFYSVSGGQVTYTNYVAGFYTAKNPKSYYTDPNITYAYRAMDLVKEALQWLDSQGFDFSTLTTDSSKNILAINCYYAGAPDSDWGKGLWPHQGTINPKVSYDGVYCYKYQMSNIGTSLSIGTTVHENGHLLCGWPDLYDYDGDSAGAGRFCVMSYNDSKNPQVPNPYYRQTAGWISYTSLNGYANGSQITVNAGALSGIYRWTGSDASEFFLVENIRKTGRWAALPGEGLLIWHIDTDGNNSYNQMTASQHFRVSVEQADGLFHLEHNNNSGQANDLYYAGNKTLFDNTTTPNSNWWNGSASGLRISNVSATGDTMTFTLGNGNPVTPTPTRRVIVTPTPTRVMTPTPTSRVTPTPTRRGTPTPTARVNTPTPTTRPTGNYVAAYVISSDWGTGATINVTIINNTATAVNGWTLAWTFPGNQTITNLWGGIYTQSGASVSVKDAGYNASIGANGGSVNFGFNINYSGTNAKPTAFTLNGTGCAAQ
ncbi:MAG: M6 family metalloprotease domain-containing protein [Firmicutes bacterium]|nr:M6 family metalloprotease domain-containing protein [Bacillota bacterium]